MASDALHSFERLLRVVGVPGYGQPTDADFFEVHERFDGFVSGNDDRPLEQVFGLLPRGPLSGLQAWLHDRRARHIRELAELLDDGTVTGRQLALLTLRDLRDYERASWKSDERRGRPMERTQAGHLRFAILSSGLPLPKDERTIRRIISGA